MNIAYRASTPPKAIKLLITDLDNTALKGDKTISKRTTEAFHMCRERGIRTGVATARAFSRSKVLLGGIGADCSVTNDGTMAHDGNKMVFSVPLPEKCSTGIINEMVSLGLETKLTVLTEHDLYRSAFSIKELPTGVKTTDFRAPICDPVYKILVNLPTRGFAEEVASRHGCRLQCYRGEDLYGFVGEGSGKVEALRALAQHLGITLSEIAAFGDDDNDVEMLSACGLGIAMANAIESAKTAADRITAYSNEEDGVARFIEDCFLG